MAAVMGQAVARSPRTSSKRGAPAGPPADDVARRKTLLKRKLDEIDMILQELDGDMTDATAEAQSEEPATGESTVASEQTGAGKSRLPVNVVVGTSAMAAERPELVGTISNMVNRAYGHMRVDKHEVMERLSMGDAGNRANRVLHVAFHGDNPVGCMSSTLRVPWCEEGCGHWGLLVVDVEMQGRGIASALVTAAEERLASNCVEIQIEYEYTPGEEYSTRLEAWYEGKCGFESASRRSRGYGTEFRKCRKAIPEDAQRRGRRLHITSIRTELAAELAALEAPEQAEEQL